VDSAVIRAALELLDEHGYDGLTMEGVAARAGVAKTTLYRRLPSRLDLIAEVARQVAAPVREHDTGDLRADLVALLQDVIGVLHEPMIRRVLPRLLAEAREREELAAILRGFWTERRRLTIGLLERAARRGELAPTVDLELAADAFYGPVYYRYLVTGAALDYGVAETIVGQAMQGMVRR
jgi:AcrR family transcriptional regulator